VLVYDKTDGADEWVPVSPVQARVPVAVVTGYLGSGKTTLIAAMLRQPDMAGTAVIVNELADVGIDQSVIADAGASDVVLLSNGCLCCARGTDLANAVRRLIGLGQSGRYSLRMLLIETSGAADPAPIVRQVCFDPQLRVRVRYTGVLCLFDASFGPGHVERDPVGYRQLALADMILVTKSDLVSTSELAQRVAWLRRLNPVPPVTTARNEANDFLSGNNRDAGRAGTSAWLGGGAALPAATHAAEIGAWSITAIDAIDWPLAEQVMRVIFDRHGDHILRTKGIIRTLNDPRPLVIHGINRHFHRPFRLSGWEADPETRIVVIGFPQAGDAAEEIASGLGGVVASVPPQPRRQEQPRPPE
jgi:G3E family GTPase